MKGETQAMLRRKYLSSFFKRNRLPYFVMFFSAILFSIFNLAVSWLVQQLIDTVAGVPGSLAFKRLAPLTIGFILLIIPLKALNYISQPRFMKRAMTQVKELAFEKLTQKNIASFQSETTSAYLSMFSNDLSAVEANYLEKQYVLVFNTVWGCGAVLLMVLNSPVLAAVAIGLCLLPFAVSSVTGAKLSEAEKAVSERNAGLVASLRDILGGFSVIKSFQAEVAALDLLRHSSESVEAEKYRKRKLSVILSAIGGLAGVLAQLGTFLAGAALALSGRGITPGMIFIFLDLTGAVIVSIREMPELLANRKAALALLDKMAASLERNIRDEGMEISKHLEQGISVHHLCFGYEAGHEILHDIDINFEAGKSYAIVGNSGSGKSTLLDLLMSSHHDYAGTICFDGLELREISSRSLYGLVSVIEQNVFVFDASIRDNITLFRDFPAPEVDRAIELSGLSQLIEQHGTDYLCGENGRGLSGGEKQRLSIARSLLKNSSVLLADEVTAALDAQTAYQVTGDILRLEGITRIIVTHALTGSLLRQYDGIIVLKDGRIVEQGTFEELLKQKGYFHALYTVRNKRVSGVPATGGRCGYEDSF